MCGIIGIVGTVGRFSASSPADLPAFRKARDIMESRGPDGSGEVSLSSPTAPVWFGHRRLAILDLSDSGSQPMYSDCGRFLISYNGEIYNSVSLREELKGCGRVFKSTCDTEVIVNGFAQWGEAIVDRLIGMFAFGIWDKKESRLFLARDRAGMKPLYYSANNQGIAFASDARSLVSLGADDGYDPEGVGLFLVFGYAPAPYSVWRGISKLPPAVSLSWRPGQTPITRTFWEPPREVVARKNPQQELEELIDQICNDHLLSDVPIGIFLSGGIDSTIIASSVGRSTGPGGLNAMTVAFPDSTEDESNVARQTAEQLNLPWEALALKNSDASTLLGPTLSVFDEPISLTAIMSRFAVSKLAATQYKVMLSGDGGDEAFGGYRWYNESKNYRHLPWYKIPFIALLNPRARQKLFASRSPLHQNINQISRAFSPDEAAELVDGVKAPHLSELVDGILQRYDAPDLPLKRRLQRLDLMTFCADANCPKVDRTSMAFGLEVRSPFLDHRLTSFGIASPVSAEFDEEPKNLIRKILLARGLKHVLQQPKKGFRFKTFMDIEDQLISKNKDDTGSVLNIGRYSQLWSGSRGRKRAVGYLSEWQRQMMSCGYANRRVRG